MSEGIYFHIEADKGFRRLEGPQEALTLLEGNGYLWMDLHDPSRAMLDAIAGPLGIHPLVVEDCLDDDQIPKIEDYRGHTFILFNRYSYTNKELQVEEVDLILGKNFLVTVSGRGCNDDRALQRIEQLLASGIEHVEKGPDLLLQVILDRLVDGKLSTISALEVDIEAAEEGMLQDLDTFHLEDLIQLRHTLLSLRKSLFHEREILVKVCRRDSPYISEGSIYHFRDIYDHLAKFFEFCEMNRDILTSLMEMYLSLVNNRMSEVANRTNRTVRRLTLITTIFMPLSLLAGIGGMSEWSMMTGGEQHWKLSYSLFLAGMLLLGGLSYSVLKWIERKD